MDRTRPAGLSRRSFLGALGVGSTLGLTCGGALAEAQLGGDSLAAMILIAVPVDATRIRRTEE